MILDPSIDILTSLNDIMFLYNAPSSANHVNGVYRYPFQGVTLLAIRTS